MRRLMQMQEIMFIVAAVLVSAMATAQQSGEPPGPDPGPLKPITTPKEKACLRSHMKCGNNPATGKVECVKVCDTSPPDTPKKKPTGKGAPIVIEQETDNASPDAEPRDDAPQSSDAEPKPAPTPTAPPAPEPVPNPATTMGEASIPKLWQKADTPPMVVESLDRPETGDHADPEASAFYPVGVEAGFFGRVQTFSPNNRRPVALGPEVQLLIRLSDRWRARFGGGAGYGGANEVPSSLYAVWILAGAQVQFSPRLNLSFGFEHEQRFAAGEVGAETNFYGGYVQAQICMSPQDNNHHVCVGVRSGFGGLESQGDVTGGRHMNPSVGAGLNLSYAFLP